MPRQQQQDEDFEDTGDEFLDDDHAAIVTFANTYLDEDERPGFIDGLMERRGYQRTESWTLPDPGQGARRPGPGGGQRGGPRPRQQSRSPYFKR